MRCAVRRSSIGSAAVGLNVCSLGLDAAFLNAIDADYRNLYRRHMKTTLDINDALLASAKALAAKQRTSLTRLIEEGLELRLRASSVTARGRRRRVPVFRGRGGLAAGVNPISNKAMLDAAGDDA